MSQFSSATAFDRTLTDLYDGCLAAMTAPREMSAPAAAARRAIRAKCLAAELALVLELPALVARAERERRQWPPEVESLPLIRRAEALAQALARFPIPPPVVRGPRRWSPGGRKRRVIPGGCVHANGRDHARVAAEARHRAEANFERLAAECHDVLRELQVVRNWEAGAQPPAGPDPAATPPPPAAGRAGKQAKGKDVNGQLMKLCTDRPECIGWSAAKLAFHLECAKSCVTGAKYWKTILWARAGRQAEAVHQRKEREGIRPGRRRPGKMPSDRA
jgi:hypothetical protein